VENVTPGTWDVIVKNCSALTQLNASRTFTAGNNTSADFRASREGDGNGNDWVTSADWSLMVGKWNAHRGESPAYSVCCDYNRDDWITSADWSTMAPNWGKSGDKVGY